MVYEKDKRIYRVDKDFMDVLNIKESVNKSINYPDENGLNIGTMQIYVNNAFKKYAEIESKNNQNILIIDDNETKIKVSNKLVKNKNTL